MICGFFCGLSFGAAWVIGVKLPHWRDSLNVIAVEAVPTLVVAMALASFQRKRLGNFAFQMIIVVAGSLLSFLVAMIVFGLLLGPPQQ
jgi:hypothetical protein